MIEELDALIRAIKQDSNPDSLDTDNDGQVIIYTNVFRKEDGSYETEE